MSVLSSGHWLDEEDDWSAARDDLVKWLLRRPGWGQGPGALDFLPSRPPCRIALPAGLGNPCLPTSIDTSELVVYPPRVEFRPDETALSGYGRRLQPGDIPSEHDVTGLPELAAEADVVFSLDIGEEDPADIRDNIDMIESWRWPDPLPHRDDRWVSLWAPGYPPGLRDLDALLGERGWSRRERRTEGDLLSRPQITWWLPQSGRDAFTTIRVNTDDESGYTLWSAGAETGLSYATTAGIVEQLDIIERWTAQLRPRWSTSAGLLAHACPRCGSPSQQRCVSVRRAPLQEPHAERVAPDLLTSLTTPPAAPRPGQRPAGSNKRR